MEVNNSEIRGKELLIMYLQLKFKRILISIRLLFQINNVLFLITVAIQDTIQNEDHSRTNPV
jgi:hypothetical protein